MQNLVRFGNFEVDVAAGQLRKHGLRVRLRDQPFQVLASLLEHPGEVVTRDDLRHRLWPGAVFVDFDNGLNIAIARLRAVLGDSAEHPRFIETLPKRGYRFIGSVEPTATIAATAVNRSRLLVLPFANLTGDSEQEHFADAITDEIITAVVSLAPERLAVIARTTCMRYKGTHRDLGRIARELHADYAVQGALHRANERLVLNVQLVRPHHQDHLFARRYEGELGDIFDLESTIADDIAAHIEEPGVAAELRERARDARPRRKATENLAAYNAYVEGRYLAERMTFESVPPARQHFESAIERDPEFALAHVALADLYSWMGYYGYMRPRDAYVVGITYALRAVELDDTLAEAHAALAEYHKQLNYDWAATEREMNRALELGPASPFVRFQHALVFLMPQNRMREAVAEIEYALELDPLAGNTRFWLGIMHLLAQEYDRAIEVAGDLYELEPNSPWPPFVTGIAYRQKYFEGFVSPGGTLDPETAAEYVRRAIDDHRRSLELTPGSDVIFGWLGLALGVCGKKEEARAILRQLERSDHYILPTSFGHLHLGLGEYDAALEWFARAVEERDQLMMPILSYADFDVLRDHPRFAELLRRMRLDKVASAQHRDAPCVPA